MQRNFYQRRMTHRMVRWACGHWEREIGPNSRAVWASNVRFLATRRYGCSDCYEN